MPDYEFTVKGIINHQYKLIIPEVSEDEPIIILVSPDSSLKHMCLSREGDLIRYERVFQRLTPFIHVVKSPIILKETRLCNLDRKMDFVNIEKETGIPLEELLAVREIELGSKFLIEDFLRKVYGESFTEITIPALK